MWKKLIILSILLVVGLAGGTYMQPWTTSYDVKTAAKVACNAQIQNAMYISKGVTTLDTAAWKKDFEARTQKAGVRLKPDQYAFRIEKLRQEGVDRCHFKVAYRSVTPWLFISDFFPEIPPLTIIHRIDAHHDVLITY